MSLDRYVNQIEVVTNPTTIRAKDISDDVAKLISYDVANLLNLTGDVENLNEVLNVESHVYNSTGDYYKTLSQTDYVFDVKSKYFYINFAKLFDNLRITSGLYKIINTYSIPLLGTFAKKPYYLAEIGSSSTELKLSPKDTVKVPKAELNRFYKILLALKTKNRLNNLYICFDNNRQYRVINYKIEGRDLYFKLVNSVDASLTITETCHFVYKVLDDTSNTITVRPEEIKIEPRKLRGPKFDVEVPDSSAATVTKSWNTLLDTDVVTTDRIVGDLLSGSRSVDLNVDYTNFSNFVFYGSAAERVRNFDYKLELIDYYTSQSAVIEQSSASSTSYAITNKLQYSSRINNLKNSFDGFEKYLYYETGSIFTHDLSGPVIPVPKYVVSDNLVNYARTSPTYQNWFADLEATASVYDLNNYNSLYWTTPDHILRDENNDQYIIFLNMIGQHFDNVYTYVRELTSIHRRDEHTKRGIPNKLLPVYAEALGWILQDTNQLSDLWLYKLGLSQSGSLSVPTGSLVSVSHEQLSNQIWRRIVNNLPYLLKTKGTERSVKALIATYGIPQTLISIKEYGGPSVNSNKPNFQEDRFSYALNFNGNSYLELEKRQVSSSYSTLSLAPQTHEFRFRTNYTSSVSMSLWAVEDSADRSNILQNIEIVHFKAHTTGSINGQYSGSHDYGYIKYSGMYENAGTLTPFPAISSSYLPLYDNDFWNIRLYTNQALYSGSNFDGTIYLDVQKASNCTDNRISISSSLSYTHPTASELYYTLGATASLNSQPHYVMVGGTTGSNSVRFSGSIQGYKEYVDVYDKSVFDEHTLNPASYHTDIYSGSYDSLIKYYPLGLDNIRTDHSGGTAITSSHPNRNFLEGTYATPINFTGPESQQYSTLSELYYVNIPSIGANNLKSQRIRIEPNIRRYDLSPTSRSEKSLYDTAQNDSNRLAIVFSPTDQINRDIVNNFGYLEFDDILGDPLDTHRDFYKPLRPIQHQYWKKYVGNSNLNTFIRIFSLYDYTVFEQIKQLIPARASYIGGVLIEGNMLERPRVLRKYPTLELLGYETTLQYNPDGPEIYYNYLTASISESYGIEMSYMYYSASITPEYDIRMNYDYLTGSVDRNTNVVPVGESLSHLGTDSQDITTAVYKLLPPVQFTGDAGDYHSPDSQEIAALYNIESNYYLLRSDVVSHPTVTSEEKMYTFKRNGILQQVTRSFDKLYSLDGLYNCIDPLKYDNNLKKAEEIVGIFYPYSGPTLINFTPTLLSDQTDIIYKYTSSIKEINPVSKSFTTLEFRDFIEQYNYWPHPYSNYVYRKQNRGYIQYAITGSNYTKGYSKVVYHYSSSKDPSLSKFYLEYQTAYSQSMKMYYSKSLAPYNYQYTEDSVRQRIRFVGSKLTGPDINVTGDNPQTVDNGPVIVVRNVIDSEFVV